jgi:hypothetical protein
MRLIVVPLDEFHDHATHLNHHLNLIGAEINPFNFTSLVDAELHALFTSSIEPLAPKGGAIWIRDGQRKELTLAMHTSSDAQSFVGNTSTASKTALENRVFETKTSEQIEGKEGNNNDRSLDQKLGKFAAFTLATPLILFDKPRGVITATRYFGSATPPQRFTKTEQGQLSRLSTLVERLVEFPIVSAAVGYDYK